MANLIEPIEQKTNRILNMVSRNGQRRRAPPHQNKQIIKQREKEYPETGIQRTLILKILVQSLPVHDLLISFFNLEYFLKTLLSSFTLPNPVTMNGPDSWAVTTQISILHIIFRNISEHSANELLNWLNIWRPLFQNILLQAIE